MRCLLLNVDMLVGSLCPCPYNRDTLVCGENCSCADNPEIINTEAWEKFKSNKTYGN